MAGEKPDVLLIGAKKPVMVKGLEPKVTLHYLADAKDQDAFIKSIADKMRAIAIAYTANKLDAAFMQKLARSSSRFRASASATTTSTPNGRARTASSSPTRRKCSTKRSPTPRSASCSARCANFRRPSVFCAPANGRKGNIRSPRRRCATAPSAWSAWAASARRSRAGWRPSACRWSITAAIHRTASLTSITRSSSTWRATSTR